MRIKSKLAAGLGALTLVGGLALVGSTGTTANANTGFFSGVHLHAHLDPLNDSGAKGNADVRWHYRLAHVDIDAYRLTKGMPHAQHIHFGAEARHECPNARDDDNGDFRLNVAEGLPKYGDIVRSLTLSGDTSPKSALAVARFPMARTGTEHYDRTLFFKRAELRRAIKTGKGVLVIHGVDYNGNGRYDMKGAGPSELDPTLPAEATDPALCGRLVVVSH